MNDLPELTTTRNAHAEESALGVLSGIGTAKPNTVAARSFFYRNAFHLPTELDDHAVMHHPVDRGCYGQGGLESLIPLREYQIGSDDDTEYRYLQGTVGVG